MAYMQQSHLFCAHIVKHQLTMTAAIIVSFVC